MIKLSKFANYGASMKVLEGSSLIFCLLAFFGSFSLAAFTLKKAFINLLPKPIIGAIEKFQRFVYWKHPFRLLIEQFLCSSLSCFLNLKYNFAFGSIEDTLNSSLAVIWLAIYLVGFPLFSVLLLKYNFHLLS
jgi:hypothetical protein